MANMKVAPNMISWLCILECFCFITHKNHNLEAIIVAAETFVSNISLAIFVFLIANVRVVID